MIRDAVTAEPIGYANVMLKEKKTGATTDQRGEFSILCTQDDQELLITRLGYKSQTVVVMPVDTLLTIELVPTPYLLQDVNIFAGSSLLERASANQMKEEQFAQLTGLTRDVYRAVQTMPGVSSNNEMNAEFNARGGTPNENLVLINGIRVYEPYHLKEIPSMSVGIFNVDMVQKIDFINGGFGAEYGDALSSVLNIEYKKGNIERVTGSGYASLIDAGITLEGPLSERCSWILGGRKSYINFLARMMGAKSNVSVAYDDWQGQLSYTLSPMSTISIGYVLSNDFFTYRQPDQQGLGYGSMMVGNRWLGFTRSEKSTIAVDYRSRNQFANIRWIDVVSPVLLLKGAISYANEFYRDVESGGVQYEYDFPADNTYYMTQEQSGALFSDLNVKTTGEQLSFSYQPATGHVLEIGEGYQEISYSKDRTVYDIEVRRTNLAGYYPDTTVIVYPLDPRYNDTTNLSVRTFKWSAYVQDQWQAIDGFVVNIGGRFDYFNMNKELSFSPRISASYELFSQWYLKAAWGIYYQAPTYGQLKSDTASPDNTANQRALHYIVGLEYHPSTKAQIKIETYYKDYTDLIAMQRLSDGSLYYASKEANEEGYAYGMDIYGSMNLSGLYATFSYSLMTARERRKGSGDGYGPRYTDQRHTISSALSTQLGSRWSGSIRFYYGSGFAFTPSKIAYNQLAIPQWVADNKNSERYPFYSRIDIRVEKQFTLWSRPLSIYLDIMNVLGRENVFAYEYTYNSYGNPVRNPVKLLPMLPSIGIMYKF